MIAPPTFAAADTATDTATGPRPAASRGLSRRYTTPPPAPGFIGEGHTAVEVLRPDALAASDPFVLLMDDRLEISAARQIGGAHPSTSAGSVPANSPV